MDNKSIWEEERSRYDFSFKKLETEVDVLIIGGGITGCTLAYFLKDYNGRVALIDKGKFGSLITANTTAKISYMQGIIYQTLEKLFNKDISRLYYDSQIDAISLIKEIINTNNIDCDLEENRSIIFALNKKNINKIENEKNLLEEFGSNIKIINNKDIALGIEGKGNYVFHPIKYINGIINVIKEKILLYEHVLAKNISFREGWYEVLTDKGVIRAKKVVVSTHYPFFLFPTFIPLKTYIKREYVCVGDVGNNRDISAINIDDELFSIRYYKNYLIYVSNKDRLTGNTNYSRLFQRSKDNFKTLFEVEPSYTFINQDVMSNDSLPFIGKIRNNLYIATGYNAWGMTNGVIASKVICDLVMTGKSKYMDLFNPNRSNFNLFLMSFIGTFHYAKAYVQSLWKKNTPQYIKIDHMLYGVYVDDEGVKHIVKLICPHMKCNLVFNEVDKTWDCPCHGSRFDLDGNILEGPAIKNISKKRH